MIYKAFCDKVINANTVDLTISLGFGIYKKERVYLFGLCPRQKIRNNNKNRAGLKAKLFIAHTIVGKDIEIEINEMGKKVYVTVYYFPPPCFETPKGIRVNLNQELLIKKLKGNHGRSQA